MARSGKAQGKTVQGKTDRIKKKPLAGAALGAAGLMAVAGPAWACTMSGEFTAVNPTGGHGGVKVSAYTTGTGLFSSKSFMLYFIDFSKRANSLNGNPKNCHHSGTAIGTGTVRPTVSVRSGKGHIASASGHIPTGAGLGIGGVCYADPSNRALNAASATFDVN
ncbi:MAG: hypothetical protein ACRDY0_09250 [Acidimicrobiales bacterium]